MSFTFTHPQWLWLLPPALAWVIWLTLKSDVQTGAVRRWMAFATRVLVTTGVVLALAGMQWRTAIEGMNVIFLLDRSDSVPAAQQEAASQWVQQIASDKKPGDRAGLIVFGSEASIESTPREALDLTKIDAVVPTTRTDIAAAIRLASAAFPENGQRRMVLISDGRENLGDALNAATSARSLDANVDVVLAGSPRKNDVAVQRLQLPSAIKEGQTFEAKVFAQSDVAGPARLRLYRNEQFLGEQTVQLDVGKNLFTFPQSLPQAGFYSYSVQVEAAGDQIPQNNRALGFTRVRGVPRVLMLSSDPAADAPLADALRSPQLTVTLAEVSRFPETLAELQSYDSLVLCNVAAGDFSPLQHSFLETAVKDFGMGLVCIGGDQAYAAGAYRGTRLARVLPVDVEISSKKVLPPGALVLVIDKSGSMSGDKLEMAKQSAMAAVAALAPGDYIGVIGFDGAPFVVTEIQRAANRDQIMRQISGLTVGGGTVMYPAIEHAHKMLRSVTASFKHCIVLTDGVSTRDDFGGLAKAMAADRITVSTVGIGVGNDGTLLEMIASVGRGRFYDVPNPMDLPQIFIKETAVILKSAISEEPFTPKLAASTEPVRGLADYPSLLGCVVTEPKPRAETPLLTGQGDPLLAHWQFGLGRAAAFTSDARAKWAKNWMGWSGYQQFWRQAVQWSLRRLDNADFTSEIVIEKGEGHLSVEAVDNQGAFRNFLHLQALVAAPDGEQTTVRLKQTAAGHYEGVFPVKNPGAYLLNLMQMENGHVRGSQVIGASLNYSPEIDASEPNAELLRRIAQTTGGKVLTPFAPGANPFYDDRRKTWQPYDLWQWLLRGAIILFVLDVGLRRLQPDPDSWRKFWQAALLHLPFRARARKTETPSEPSLAALLARRDEVRTHQTKPVESTPAELFQPSRAWTPPVAPATAKTSPAAATLPELPGESEITDASESKTTSRLLEAKRRAQQRRQ